MSRPLNKVLYLEDDPHISEVAMIAMRDIGGLNVIHCETGADAISQIESFQPDLLLFDVMLPDMDGPQTLDKIRNLSGFEMTPVIFMTAKAQVQEQKRYVDLGALTVIVKPFDALMLADQLRSVWSARASVSDACPA
tara:strand:- start:7686 stop:8096 length:411 start_codon:yes stop_codon:yes gene_type:complete